MPADSAQVETRPATVGNSPVSTGESAPAGKGTVGADEVSSLQSAAPGRRRSARRLLAAARGYLVPPNLLACPPPAVSELVAYARWGAWTARDTGPVRFCGLLWLALVATPLTVVCRYTEWVWQRPGRAIPVALLWQLLLATGPGSALADNILRPILTVVVWAFL